MRIRKTYNGTVPNNKIVNSESNSTTDTYSCNYLNSKEYELDFETAEIIRNTTYQTFKTGKVVTITGRFGTYDNKIVANTNITFANLPNDIKPKANVYCPAILIVNNDGSYLGQARIVITSTGELVVRPYATVANKMIDIYMTITYLTN